MSDNPGSKKLVDWLKKSLCINPNFSPNNPTSTSQVPFAQLLSITSKSTDEDPAESFELAAALKFLEKETQTELANTKDGQRDTPKLGSQRAREILASRINSASSSPDNFNRFDFRYKSEIIRGANSTPKSLPKSNSMQGLAEKPESPKIVADPDDFVNGIQSQGDFYFDDDFSCSELPINLQLGTRCDDQLDMSSFNFNGFESLFDKSLLTGQESINKTADLTNFETEDVLQRIGAFKDYLDLVPKEDLV